MARTPRRKRERMTRRRYVFGGTLILPRFLGFGALLAFAACQGQPHNVVVFHTDSLSPLLQTVSRRFEANNPDVAILGEAAESLETIGKVADLGRACDLLAIADHRLISRLLIPEHAQGGYEFLGNELVLAASERRLFEPLTRPPRRRKDWFELLLGGSHSYGVSDPDQGPAGYYTQLSWKLAELHYNRTALYRRLINGLDPRWVRPRSSELVELLKNKTVNFAFLYKSVALQNGLDFIDLPAQVSLSEPSYAQLYSQVSLRVRGDRAGSVMEVSGAPIRYGICLIGQDNPWARRFLEYVLSTEAQSLYRELGYRSIDIREIRQPE